LFKVVEETSGKEGESSSGSAMETLPEVELPVMA
jgi:hypothetical protein